MAHTDIEWVLLGGFYHFHKDQGIIGMAWDYKKKKDVEDIPEDLKKKRPDKKREQDMEDFDIHFEKRKKRKFIPFDKNGR